MTTRAQSRVMPSHDPLLASVPLLFQHVFYPYGFPIQIKSNDPAVVEAAERSWGMFRQRFEEAPIEARYLISEGPKKRCAAPVFRAQNYLLTMVADAHNYGCCDLIRGFGAAWLTKATVIDEEYFRYSFLEAMVLILLGSLHVVLLHAACVVRDGRGVLLVADSGVGKSSLAYACARRGWKYVSDDSTSLLLHGTGRKVIGNPQLFRFRPAAVDLFPELRSEAILRLRSHTRLRKGKPTLEIWTESLPKIQLAQEATIDHIVFLKRDGQFNGSARLLPASRETALRRLLPNVWATELPFHQQRSAAVKRLLEAQVCEMFYCNLDAAVDLLEQVVHRGLS
jgi:hypothetical protein